MPNTSNVLTFVMAGGTGSRLQPLTATRCKPSLPFGRRHLVVDFVLGNLLNSGLDGIQLLVQYRPQSLVQHVRRQTFLPWAQRGRVAVLPPPAHSGPEGYRGTAHAVHQNLHRVHALRPDLVVVFGADHIYRMDVQQMIDFHLAQRADATVATLPVPLAQARGFGIVAVDAQQRARGFVEKPAQPAAMPGRPGHALASMGNYVFSAEVLADALARCDARGETDFGHHVLPRLLRSHRVMAYDFSTNQVPGVAPHEERGYWRDVGTVDAYFDAHMDTLGPRPRFDLGNLAWPAGAPATAAQGEDLLPAEVVGGELHASSLGSGASVDHAVLRRTVAGAGAQVQRGAVLDGCILMAGSVVGAGARLSRVIVDEDNVVPAGEVIGHDAENDRRRFPVSPQGVVVVPRGYFAAPARRGPAGVAGVAGPTGAMAVEREPGRGLSVHG